MVSVVERLFFLLIGHLYFVFEKLSAITQSIYRGDLMVCCLGLYSSLWYQPFSHLLFGLPSVAISSGWKHLLLEEKGGSGRSQDLGGLLDHVRGTQLLVRGDFLEPCGLCHELQ